MIIKQVTNYVTNLAGGAIRLPKYALYAYDKPARAYYVICDVRKCALVSFPVERIDAVTGEVSVLHGSAITGVGVLFARFADSLPLSAIQAPEYGRFHGVHDIAPRDRKPQKFDRRARPEKWPETGERSVVDGCVKGGRRYRQEGYYKTFLQI